MYIKNEKKLMAPMLDRLLQHESGVRANYLKHQQLRESVRRDLEHMMNTRYRCISLSDELGQVRKGIPNYGLPALSAINLKSSEALNKFCRQVADAVRHYEPRIKFTGMAE